MNYSEKLRDPRWQKRRLEIMQRDNFHCKKCGGNEITQHVHHKYYLPGKDPWDYPDGALVTLCIPCHEEEGYFKDSGKNIPRTLLKGGFLNSDLEYTDWVIGEAIKEVGKDGFLGLLRALQEEPIRDQFIKIYKEFLAIDQPTDGLPF